MATLDLLTSGVVTGTASGSGLAARIDGAGTAQDTSASNTLRQTIDMILDADGVACLNVDVEIQTGETSSGPWRTLDSYRSDVDGFQSRRRVVVSGLDSYTRLVWALRGAGALNPQPANDYTPVPKLTLESVGEAI